MKVTQSNNRSRFIVSDPSAPSVPARGGYPAIPAGKREATPEEVEAWWNAHPDMLARAFTTDNAATATDTRRAA